MRCQEEGNKHSCDKSLGGKWRNLDKSEEQILGVAFTHVGFDTYSQYKVEHTENFFIFWH